MTLAVTAIVVGAAGVGVGAFNAFEGASNSSFAKGEAGSVFGEQQSFANQLNQLISNPSSVTNTPGYAFNFGQGADAVSREMGASGLHGSGNEAAALTQYGQDFAMQSFNQQASLLASLSGLQASSSPAQLTNAATASNANSTSQLSSLFNSLGFLGAIGGGGFGGGGGGNYTTPATGGSGGGIPGTPY